MVPSVAFPLAVVPFQVPFPLAAVPFLVPSVVVPSTSAEAPLAVQTGIEWGMVAAVGTSAGAVRKLRGWMAVPGGR